MVQVVFLPVQKISLASFGRAAESYDELQPVRITLTTRDRGRQFEYSSWQDPGLFTASATLTDDRGNDYGLVHFPIGVE